MPTLNANTKKAHMTPHIERVKSFAIGRKMAGGCLLLMSIGTSAALVQTAAASDELLFMSNRQDSVFELWRMAADGTHVQRVLPERGEASDMSWSPNGSRVLYTAARDGGQLNIYIAAVGDGKSRQLTHDGLPNTEPVWSPDGKTIAFVSSRDGSRRIYLMDVDGSRQRRLTDVDTDDEFAPRFSPDGAKLAYIAGNRQTISPRVAVADLRTGKSRIISDYAERAIESMPVWAPDSSRLLFTLIKGQTSHIFVMAADGSARRRLTADGNPRNSLPQWSPDGRRILFLSVSAQSARQGLYLMNADGTATSALRTTSNDVMDARWSSDGRHVFFVEYLPGGGKIFSVDASGGEPRRLSGNEGFDLNVQVCCSRPSADQLSARR